MAELITCAIALILLILVLLWKQIKDESHANLPPGTFGLPLIGETFTFARKKIRFFVEKHAKYGRVFKTHLLGKPTVRVSGAENIRKIITGEGKYVQSSFPKSVRLILGDQSIAMSHDEVHKQRKRYLMKYISPEFLRNHVPILAQTISDRVLEWCDVPAINLYTECRNLFIELSARFLIKIDISQEDVNKITTYLDIIMNNIFCLPINLPGFGLYKALQAKQRLREILVSAMNKPCDNNNNVTGDFCSVFEGLRGLNTGIIDIKKDELYIDSIIELLFSSTETVGSAGFVLAHELIKNKDVYKKLQTDIEENDSEGCICANDLHEMKYVDAVVKETLRVAPPAGGAYRTATETFELDGYTIPKGWSIVYSIRDTHHNDQTVSSPLQFKPDRWMNSEFSPDKYAFIPFGAGKRICPGQTYAKTILKLFSVEFARSCSPNLLQDSQIDLWPTPRPLTTIVADIKRRSQQC